MYAFSYLSIDPCYLSRVRLTYSSVQSGIKVSIQLSSFLSRPSGLELGRDSLISGARVIQLIGAILPVRAVSLVIGLVGDRGGGRQHAPVVNLPAGAATEMGGENRKGHRIVIRDPDLTFPQAVLSDKNEKRTQRCLLSSSCLRPRN